jgi:nucleoside-triphosphatase THEP1
MSPSRLLKILTGTQGIGKTTWLLSEIERERAAGRQVDGVVTPPVFRGDEKIGITLRLLPDDIEMPFARARGLDDSQERFDHHMGWVFDEEAFAAAEAHLSRLKDEREHMTCAEMLHRPLYIDELGVLELYRDTGFRSALELLDHYLYLEAVVVVRPDLLDRALSRWPEAEVITVPAREAANKVAADTSLPTA